MLARSLLLLACLPGLACHGPGPGSQVSIPLAEVPSADVTPLEQALTAARTALDAGYLELAREHLARFAYPRRVVFEEFPRNTSGKIDRSATKERFAERG